MSEIHTMEFMAGAVKGLLDSLKLRRAFLTGHSMGGYVALAFLELFPEFLKAIVFFIHIHLQIQPRSFEKREREIKIVKAGKKYLIVS